VRWRGRGSTSRSPAPSAASWTRRLTARRRSRVDSGSPGWARQVAGHAEDLVGDRGSGQQPGEMRPSARPDHQLSSTGPARGADESRGGVAGLDLGEVTVHFFEQEPVRGQPRRGRGPLHVIGRPDVYPLQPGVGQLGEPGKPAPRRRHSGAAHVRPAASRRSSRHRERYLGTCAVARAQRAAPHRSAHRRPRSCYRFWRRAGGPCPPSGRRATRPSVAHPWGERLSQAS
jgi:hypothetical protein